MTFTIILSHYVNKYQVNVAVSDKYLTAAFTDLRLTMSYTFSVKTSLADMNFTANSFIYVRVDYGVINAFSVETSLRIHTRYCKYFIKLSNSVLC